MYLGFWRLAPRKPAPLQGVGEKCASEVSKSGIGAQLEACKKIDPVYGPCMAKHGYKFNLAGCNLEEIRCIEHAAYSDKFPNGSPTWIDK